METLIKYFFTALSLLFLCQVSAQEIGESKIWSEDYQLQWSDFKGEPQNNTDAIAITASGITFGYSVTQSETEIVEANFTIESHFYPNHSWCLKDRVHSVVLNHERFHFNITELFARKFRKQISETNFSLNIKEEVDAIYKNINNELAKMQKAYDTATNYSINIETQSEWQDSISRELKKYSKFKLDI